MGCHPLQQILYLSARPLQKSVIYPLVLCLFCCIYIWVPAKTQNAKVHIPYTLGVTKSKSTIKRIGNFTKSAIFCRFGNRVYTHLSPNNSKKQTVNHCFKATFFFSKKPTASQTYLKLLFLMLSQHLKQKKQQQQQNSKKNTTRNIFPNLAALFVVFYGTSKPCCSIGVSCSKPALRHLTWNFFEMKKRHPPKNEHAENPLWIQVPPKKILYPQIVP